MKKSESSVGILAKALLIHLFCTLPFTAFAQKNWTQISPLPGPTTLSDIHMASELVGVTFGSYQNATTVDGGENWTSQQVNASIQNFPTRLVGYSLTTGSWQPLYRTDDGGLTWTLKTVLHRVTRISFANDSVGFAFGNSSERFIYRTTNSGLLWDTMTQAGGDTNFFVQLCATSASTIFGRTSNNKAIFKSTNGGVSWVRTQLPGIKTNVYAHFLNPLTGWICGDSGKVARTTDGGAAWQISAIPTTSAVLRIQFINTANGWLLTANGKMYSSDDGGANWIPVGNPTESIARGFDFLNDNLGWACGNSGLVSKTTDGGATWQLQSKPFRMNLNGVTTQNPNKVWISGDKGMLAVSKDKGRSWSRMTIDSLASLHSIRFLNNSTAVVAGQGKIYKTTDSGATWNSIQLVPGNNNTTLKVQFIGPDTGYAIGQDGFSRTYDGGATWSFSPNTNSYKGRCFHFISAKTGFKIDYLGNISDCTLRVSKTSDYGASWTPLFQGQQPTIPNEIFFINEQVGWIALPANNVGLMKTINGGSTWNLISGKNYNYITFTSPTNGYGISNGNLVNLDGDGNWKSRDFYAAGEIPFQDILIQNGKAVMAVGKSGIIIVNANWRNTLATGSVVKKQTSDCFINPIEAGLPGRLVVANPGNIFASTQANGQFELALDTGSYSISQMPFLPIPATMDNQICPVANSPRYVSINGEADSIEGNDFKNEVRPCPILVVQQNQGLLRPCMKSGLQVTINNMGGVPSDTEFVYLKFPLHLHLISASLPFTYHAADSTYRFKINPLQPFESVTFSIIDSVSCNQIGINGQVLCVKAILPNVPPCLIQAPNWDGADLEVSSQCVANQTRFTIHNKGVSMSATAQYRILIDSALVYEAPFQLANGSHMTITLPAITPAGFVRLVVPQSLNHPLSTFASAEANCAAGLSTDGIFPQPDESPLVDIECATVVNSCDPNDKQVFPTGWGADGNIEPGTEFKYTIRFQNTGTDTAFKVVLIDTLDEDLDIASIQTGSASHPLQFNVSGKGRPVLQWTFDNILLPDSNTNLEGSNGFVTFSIRPKAGLALGTRLENFVDIYFDFNDPVRTNTTVNTLWVPTLDPGVLDTVFVTEVKQKLAAKSLTIRPNPAQNVITIQLSEENTAQVDITDLHGRILQSSKVVYGQVISIGDLKPGVYFLKTEGYKTERLVVKP